MPVILLKHGDMNKRCVIPELLDGRFKEIAKGKISTKAGISNYPNVRVCRCEHHYIFFMRPQESLKPVILAVLHERMNLLESSKKGYK